MDAVLEAGENAQGQKNTTLEGGGVRYSISRTQHMDWLIQIRGALNKAGAIGRNDTLVVDTTYQYLHQEGVENLPFAIPLRVLTKAQTGKDASHSIKNRNLIRLQQGMRNGPIVINNPSRRALVFITDLKQDGKPVLVAFQRNAVFDGDNVHIATSIHLQMDVQSMLKALPADATVYVKNKDELNAAVGVANNLRSLAANIEFIDDIVTGSGAKVKNKSDSGPGTIDAPLDAGQEGKRFSLRAPVDCCVRS